MNRLFITSLILIGLNTAQYGFAADLQGYKDDIIYLQLDENAQRNPIKHEEDIDLQGIENDLPENNANNQDSKTDNDRFSLDDIFDKNKDDVIDEDTLFGKIYHKKITRTDIPTYLLREELTFRPEKGPVSKVQFYGAYRGSLSSNWNADDKSFTYDFGVGQVGMIGKFRNTKNDFKILFNPVPRSGMGYMQNFLSDVYIVNSSIPHHKVVLGYSRNQVGKEGGTSTYILPFVARSQIARTFGNTRALGVRVIGNYSLADYNLALNSSDRYFRDWFPGAEFTGWVDLKPFGRTDGRYGNLTIGGGLNAGHNKIDYAVGSFYVGYKYKKLWTNFEYAIADGYNGINLSTNKAQGLAYTIGWKIIPQVQIIGRYDRFDPNRDVGNNNRTEYTAGINYFIKGQAVKLILNYVFCQNEAASDSHRIIFGTQLLL